MISHSVRRPPTPSPLFDAYWTFAKLRQDIFHQRVFGSPPPWTNDPVLLHYRFTNTYRATDRVSQYLIRHVAYTGDQSIQEVVFRVLLFKLFNRISTWDLLASELGQLRADEFDLAQYDELLSTALDSGSRLYSAAYIMPPAAPNTRRKHTSHLQLLQNMLSDHLPERLHMSTSMSDAFELLLGNRGIGKFLAYQFVIDLNYSAILEFSEMDFVMAGPGAQSGLRKCFTDPGDYSAEDLIRWTADRQEIEFDSRQLDFKYLLGRRIQLIDCQNLYCEVDKYARVMYPEIKDAKGRNRIKQRYVPTNLPVELWFPPKWLMTTDWRLSGCDLNFAVN
jgi:hypothetical protein